jgi:hypothetical protein
MFTHVIKKVSVFKAVLMFLINLLAKQFLIHTKLMISTEFYFIHVLCFCYEFARNLKPSGMGDVTENDTWFLFLTWIA